MNCDRFLAPQPRTLAFWVGSPRILILNFPKGSFKIAKPKTSAPKINKKSKRRR